jgi:hypothetical protein
MIPRRSAWLLAAPRYFKRPNGNVAPRFGIAYRAGERADWGTVLRAGFGVFYDLGQDLWEEFRAIFRTTTATPTSTFHFL